MKILQTDNFMNGDHMYPTLNIGFEYVENWNSYEKIPTTQTIFNPKFNRGAGEMHLDSRLSHSFKKSIFYST